MQEREQVTCLAIGDGNNDTPMIKMADIGVGIRGRSCLLMILEDVMGVYVCMCVCIMYVCVCMYVWICVCLYLSVCLCTYDMCACVYVCLQ